MAVVAHNLTAQYTNRQLNLTTNRKSKSSEKLASGYKINRGADDAAGLQISEKMGGQIRGLNQASRNIQDGVSLCQVAEGGLNETHSLLQRMKELAVQAANDTNTDADRSAISQEINQLTTEVDRIARTTSFNGSIYPLNAQKLESPYVYTAGGKNYELTETSSSYILSNTYDGRYSLGRTDAVKSNGNEYYLGDTIKLEGIHVAGSSTMVVQAGGRYSVTDKLGFVYNNIKRMSDGTIALSFNVPYNASTLNCTSNLKLSDIRIDENNYAYYRSLNGEKMYLAIDNGDIVSVNKKNLVDVDYLMQDAKTSTLHIQSGALRDQSIDMEMIDATCSGIGLGVPVQVSSFEEAGASIENIDQAIENVSAYRSTWGALQNRLEHAMSVDDNTAENTQYAESRIRDTDMAEEMVEYAKNNILEQVGQSMLAQANQSNQGVLSLLQ